MSTDTRIESVLAWEALDSRGNPTVGTEVRLRGGGRGTAIVPAGASTGSHEARELRDGGTRHGGRGVRRAVANVGTEIGPAVRGLDAADQAAVDRIAREVDGTADLGRLGANAILAVSLANQLAAADGLREPLYRLLGDGAPPLLPMPMVNIVSGGAHAGWSMDVQDILAVPLGASSLAEAIEWAARVRRAAAELVAARDLTAALVADEGGLGPPLPGARAGLEIVTAAIERSGLTPLADVAIAVDVAATQLVGPGGYRLGERGTVIDSERVIATIAEWARAFPIVSVEDPLGEEDWDGWTRARDALAGLQVLGDDLFATDLSRLRRGIAAGAADAVLVKPNQNGTVSGTKAVVEEARQAGLATVISARSGDTEDSWLADFAVGWRTGQIKVGSTMRAERTAKWNRLLQIEAELGGAAEFAGRAALELRVRAPRAGLSRGPRSSSAG
ncbi:MAG: phosphopyruvate hydratase [Actinobacteria bacterium]|nr:phosphopyruvate hydratase [Actinomycetota bacterium]